MRHRTTGIGAALAARVKRHRARLIRALGDGGKHSLDPKRARVASRRLREALGLIAAGAPGVPSKRAARLLRDVRKAFGARREAEVHLAEFTAFVRRNDW